MKWYFDENGYIYEQAPDDAEGDNVLNTGTTDLNPLLLTWSFNDHSFWRWKWYDGELTENENIKLYAIVTFNDPEYLLTDTYTKSDFESLPEGVENVEVTTTQGSNLFADCGAPNYKIVDSEVVTRTDTEKIPCAKIKKDEQLKNDYMNDILWTDSAMFYYDKHLKANSAKGVITSSSSGVVVIPSDSKPNDYWNSGKIEINSGVNVHYQYDVTDSTSTQITATSFPDDQDGELYILMNSVYNDLDSWFDGVMKYWQEGRTEREANKTALENAETIAEIEAIEYTPTHE
jgi:hypothetical protein